MKDLLFTLIAAAVIATPLYAANPQSQKGMGMQGQQGMGMQGEGMATGGQREKMQQNFQEMQRTMQQIHATNDPAKRRQLIQEHMQQMQQGMRMMGSMMGGGGKGMMGNQDMSRMPMEDRMNMMQQNMHMMQMMMNQMMEHQQMMGQ